ncbi:MAG: hypothetical protein DMF84_11680 [Acidobacteria bacterium]|nr:MAG: hypothetical protein DMF84_11680 [Acidobacteriota bacterium]
MTKRLPLTLLSALICLTSVSMPLAQSGAPAAPTLAPTQAYSTFHPMEVIRFSWSAVPQAATYVLQASTDPSFPPTSTIKFDNIPNPAFAFAVGNPEGNYSARVFAVDANGVFSPPSNVITFSVFYNNPIGPPPTLASPASGSTLTLPITVTWNHVPNPQPSGYELQIARDSNFSSIEEDAPQLNGPSRTVLSLTSGTKFWRVRSFQGDASPTTAAATAWSAVRSFTIPTMPPRPVSITLTKDPLFPGESTWVQVQLTNAVAAGGATINMTSSNPSVAPVPATISMPGNIAWTQFMIQVGQVTQPTPVTLTATLNSFSASQQFTVQPPSLKSLELSPPNISGSAPASALVMLNGQAPSGGAVVSLASNNPAVTPPTTITVPAGDFSASTTVPTGAVTAPTTATVTATWKGVTSQSSITVRPQQPPASLTLSPSSTVNQDGSFATVTVASPATYDETLLVSSSNPATARVNNSVMIPTGMTTGGFDIFTSMVSVSTPVTISVTGGGVTRSATLTVNPAGTPPPSSTLSALTVNPTSVTGGNPSTGTVTLSSVAPAGGTVVSLSSNQPGAASVPASVTVPAGATSANFTVTTFPVNTTTVQLAASLGGTFQFAALTVNAASSPPPPPPAQGVTLTVTASGRSGERVVSTPTGINVTVGSTGSASFGANTKVTLSVSNGRDAVWSGACSSAGNKAKTCAFTITSNATVNANVQ